jgi:hypothetical protein
MLMGNRENSMQTQKANLPERGGSSPKPKPTPTRGGMLLLTTHHFHKRILSSFSLTFVSSQGKYFST